MHAQARWWGVAAALGLMATTFSQVTRAVPVTDLSVWMDASDVDADGSPDTSNGSLETWSNRAGNGIDFSQEVGSYQPTWSETAINGRPGVQFDGTQFMTASDPGADSPVNLVDKAHFFAVVQSDGWADGLLSKGTGGGGPAEYLFEVGATDATAPSSVDVWLGNNGWVSSSANIVAANTPVVVEVSFDSTLSSGNVKFHVNGSPAGTVTTTYSLTQDAALVYLGQQGFYNPLTGAIGDLLLYKGVLDDDGRNAVGFYLEQKYGLDTAYVPEPGAFLLLSVVGLGLVRRPRRGIGAAGSGLA